MSTRSPVMFGGCRHRSWTKLLIPVPPSSFTETIFMIRIGPLWLQYGPTAVSQLERIARDDSVNESPNWKHCSHLLPSPDECWRACTSCTSALYFALSFHSKQLCDIFAECECVNWKTRRIDHVTSGKPSMRRIASLVKGWNRSWQLKSMSTMRFDESSMKKGFINQNQCCLNFSCSIVLDEHGIPHDFDGCGHRSWLNEWPYTYTSFVAKSLLCRWKSHLPREKGRWRDMSPPLWPHLSEVRYRKVLLVIDGDHVRNFPQSAGWVITSNGGTIVFPSRRKGWWNFSEIDTRILIDFQ